MGEQKPGAELAMTLTLDSPDFRTVRNKFLFVKLSNGWYFVTVAQMEEDKSL
jgi:hypothetical protein